MLLHELLSDPGSTPGASTFFSCNYHKLPWLRGSFPVPFERFPWVPPFLLPRGCHAQVQIYGAGNPATGEYSIGASLELHYFPAMVVQTFRSSADGGG